MINTTFTNTLRRRMAQRLREQKDSGMSLVELLVYIVLLAVLGALITSLVVSVLRVNTNVTNVSNANNDAQVLMDRVEVTVRNAAALNVVDLGSGSQALVAQVRSTSSAETPETQRCVGIVYRADTGTMWYYSGDSKGPLQAISAGSASWNSNQWSRFLEGVSRANAGTPVFTLNGTSVNTMFSLEAGSQEPVILQSTTDIRLLGGVSSSKECL